MSYRLAGLGSQLAVVVLASMTLDRGELLFVVLGLLLGWNVLLICCGFIEATCRRLT